MNDDALAGRLRAAAELLQAISHNRALLAEVSEEERTRLLQAAGRVSRPDAVDRRRLRKAQLRQRQSEKLKRAESVLSQTGIRAGRRETAFTTPNVFPPSSFAQQEIE